MKVKDLINKLKTYDENCIVTINCPDTDTTRDIWYFVKITYVSRRRRGGGK